MARDPDDIDALLAEVERSLSPGASAKGGAAKRRPEPAASAEPAPRTGRAVQFRSATVGAVVPAALITGLVGLVFLFVPLLGGVSGLAGAFLGALLAGFVARLRG